MAKKVIIAPTKYKETAMWIRLGGMLVTAVLVAMTLGCTAKEQVAAAVIEDKVFTVTPVSVQVKTGILTGEMAEMKVTERVEKGSGRIDSAPKLTGTLKLKNNSAYQSVRFIGGRSEEHTSELQSPMG